MNGGGGSGSNRTRLQRSKTNGKEKRSELEDRKLEITHLEYNKEKKWRKSSWSMWFQQKEKYENNQDSRREKGTKKLFIEIVAQN